MKEVTFAAELLGQVLLGNLGMEADMADGTLDVHLMKFHLHGQVIERREGVSQMR